MTLDERRRCHPRFRTRQRAWPGRPRFSGPPQGPRLSRIRGRVRAVFVLLHADTAGALHGQVSALARAYRQRDRPPMAATVSIRRAAGPTARLGDIRRLLEPGLPHPDRRRTDCRPLAGPPHDAARRRSDHVDRPLPDGNRRPVPVRPARADRRGRVVQRQYREPGGRALQARRPAPRNGVPDLLHCDQRQRDRRSADLGHLGRKGCVALRLWRGRGGHGCRAATLHQGGPVVAGR